MNNLFRESNLFLLAKISPLQLLTQMHVTKFFTGSLFNSSHSPCIPSHGLGTSSVWDLIAQTCWVMWQQLLRWSCAAVMQPFKMVLVLINIWGNMNQLFMLSRKYNVTNPIKVLLCCAMMSCPLGRMFIQSHSELLSTWMQTVDPADSLFWRHLSWCCSWTSKSRLAGTHIHTTTSLLHVLIPGFFGLVCASSM